MCKKYPHFACFRDTIKPYSPEIDIRVNGYVTYKVDFQNKNSCTYIMVAIYGVDQHNRIPIAGKIVNNSDWREYISICTCSCRFHYIFVQLNVDKRDEAKRRYRYTNYYGWVLYENLSFQ